MIPASAHSVNSARDELFPRTGFSQNQDSRIGGSDSFNLSQNPLAALLPTISWKLSLRASRSAALSNSSELLGAGEGAECIPAPFSS